MPQNLFGGIFFMKLFKLPILFENRNSKQLRYSN